MHRRGAWSDTWTAWRQQLCSLWVCFPGEGCALSYILQAVSVSLTEHSRGNVPWQSVPVQWLPPLPFCPLSQLGIFSMQLWLTDFCDIIASFALQSESETRSVVSSSLWPHGLYSPWNSPGQNTGVGIFSSPGDLPNPGIELRSPVLQVDSLPAEPQGKPKNSRVGTLSLFQRIFPTQESNQDLLHCRCFTNWAIREAQIILRKWYFRRLLDHHSLIISCYRFTSQFCSIGKSSGYLTWIGFCFF